MRKKILILGGTGMLGHVLFRKLLMEENLDVYATARSVGGIEMRFTNELMERLLKGGDVENFNVVLKACANIQPDIIINCIGLIQQRIPKAQNIPSMIKINSLLPHRLSLLCKAAGIRMIHISTDGVFDGRKGSYNEKDEVNMSSPYGMTKFLGEVSCPNCLTLRTSILGHELKGKTGLVEWFLAQEGHVKGYTKAIYTGLPTIEIAEIISDYILPSDNLWGVYHVSSEPIPKYDLLCLIADRYRKKIRIEAFDEYIIDRSLDSSAFRALTGYKPPSWLDLVDKMYLDYIKYERCLCV